MPVLDGGSAFERCLASIGSSTLDDLELIVVDDGSTDDSAERASRHGAIVLATGGPHGPGAARNRGAERASGDWLVFLDADCELHPDTLAAAAGEIRRDPDLGAVFGSYDDSPAAPGLVARYKNLVHHYVHQTADPDAKTFWAGCGAVRREAFEAVGGFDAELFPRPSIEDIELGYRLRDAGYRIRVCRGMRVKHLKAWTLGGLVRTDVLDRGVPWSRLMLERGRIDPTLNVRWPERLASLGAWLAVGAAVATFWFWTPAAALVAVALALAVVALDAPLYAFLARRGGVALAAGSVPLRFLHHLYSAVAFVLGVGAHFGTRRERRR